MSTNNKYWVGFVADKLYFEDTIDSYGTAGKTLTIFTSKKKANARFEDVRRVVLNLEKKA